MAMRTKLKRPLVASVFLVGTTLLGSLWPAAAFAQTSIQAYPQLPSLSLSSRYTMAVNGTNVPVNLYQGQAFAWFGFSGTANVTITVSETVASYQLSPKRYAPAASVSGRVISFTLSEPRKLVLRHVNASPEELFIFADPLEANPPVPGAPGVFNVQTFGANPSGLGNSATAIQQAIEMARAYSGGGIAYVPAGTYNISSSVSLKSNVNLYLAPGAVIQIKSGSYSVVPFPIKDTVNATISGRGVIYGADSNVTSAQVQTFNNRNLHLRDVLLVGGPSTLLRLGYEVDSGLHNLKILAGGPALADGVDFDGMFNVVVEQSFIWSTDDNFAVGSGTVLLAYRRPANTDGLIIRNNVLRQTSSGHSLSIVAHIFWQHVRNVLFENNDSVTASDGLGMYPSGSVVVLSGITVRNNRYEDLRNKFLDFQSVDFFTWGGCSNGFINHESGSVHAVLLDNNVVDTRPPVASRLVGRSPSQNIDDVRINRLYLAGALATSHATANISLGQYVTNVQYTNIDSPAMPVADPTKIVSIPSIDSSCSGTVGTPLSDPSYSLPSPWSTSPAAPTNVRIVGG
jgi:polygalacturonase